MRLDDREHEAGRWLDVRQAAEELGVSSDAVRKRIARGTLRSAKQEDGSVRVWLDSVDAQRDADPLDSWTVAGHQLDDIVSAKDEILRDLREQLEHMRRESERKDAIIMQMAQANTALAAKVPQLEAASDVAGGSVVPSEERGNGEMPQDGDYRERGWWRRFFGL
jgi:hypothetical protein